jgi:hypothetical protein
VLHRAREGRSREPNRDHRDGGHDDHLDHREPGFPAAHAVTFSNGNAKVPIGV